MRLNLEGLQLAAGRSFGAIALSSILLLPAFGPVPPALADGDVRTQRWPLNHKHAVSCTLLDLA